MRHTFSYLLYLYLYFGKAKEPTLQYCIYICIYIRILMRIIAHHERFSGCDVKMIFSFWSCLFDPKSSHLKQLFTPNRQICNEHCFFCKPHWHTVERCLTIFLLLCNHKICAEIWWHTKNCFIQFSQVDLLTMKTLQKWRKINPT